MAIHNRPNPINKIDKSSYASIYKSHSKYVNDIERRNRPTTAQESHSLMSCKVRIRYIQRYFPEYAV